MKKICLAFFLFIPLLIEGEEAPLRVGMELSYPPFESICPNGKPCGISVEIANALAHHLNREVSIENISFIGLIPSLKNETIDLIISSMSITPERQKSIDFSIPYGAMGLALLVNMHSPLMSIGDANNPHRIIVVKSGTTGEIYAREHLPHAHVRVMDQEALCVLEVVQGKADAFIFDQLSVYKNWQKNLSSTRAILTPFKKEYWAIGIRKGNPLVKEVNQFIEQYKKEGGFEKLGDKFLPEAKAAFKKMNIPFIF